MGLKDPRRRRASYEPQYTGPRLPLVDDFRLENILHGPLSGESQQLAACTMAVSRNYQADLRREIRNKLHIEQKLQYKNIDIAKLAHLLNKTLESRNKRIGRALATTSEEVPENGLDVEVSRLLDLSINASKKVHRLAGALARIEAKMDRKGNVQGRKNQVEYPHVDRLLQGRHSHASSVSQNGGEGNLVVNGSNAGILKDVGLTKEELPQPEGALKDVFSMGDPLVRTNGVSSKSSSKAPSLESEPASKSSILTTETSQMPRLLDPFEAEASHPVSPPLLAALRQSTPLPEPELLDPEQFEQFMSSAIYTYRKLQQKKYANTDIFMSEQLHDLDPQMHKMDFQLRQDSVDSTVSSNESIQKYPYEAGNPLNLLYLSLITSSYLAGTSKDTMGPSLAPFAAVKSLATVMLTPQISHFKKLRINGSPITSATFQKIKDRQQNCDCEPPASGETNGDISPAGRALVESLGLDSLRLISDDDTWNSSGLVSETESDQMGTSESSEIDSSSSDDEASLSETVAGSTNQYYSSLQSDMKLKKKLLKKTIAKQKRKLLKYAARQKELSPTPKHKPSHHTLQPKSSILKMPKGVPQKPQKGVAVAPESGELEITPGPLQLSDFAATGAFVKPEESCDEYEVSPYRGVGVEEGKGLQSLLKLRDFLQT